MSWRVLFVSLVVLCAACGQERAPAREGRSGDAPLGQAGGSSPLASSPWPGEAGSGLGTGSPGGDRFAVGEDDSGDLGPVSAQPADAAADDTGPAAEAAASEAAPDTPNEFASGDTKPGSTQLPAAGVELRREYPSFAEGAAPRWPFVGLVQLWPSVAYAQEQGVWVEDIRWFLRYWSWDEARESYPQVELPGLRISCPGDVALAVHGERGVEVGGPSSAVSGTYLVPWGSPADRVDAPSGLLASGGRTGASNVAVSSQGDWVHVGSGPQGRSYAMRDPVRPDGGRWDARARHDGDLFLLTVHPAHLECYPGVSWMSLAATGELVACGANSAATAFVAPAPSGDLVLPEPEQMGTYLGCAPQLDLQHLPFTAQRELIAR